MLAIGPLCLLGALGFALTGAVASLVGAQLRNRSWLGFGRAATFAVTALLLCAFVLLELAFLRSDFHVALVAGHSSTTTPVFYRATAMWSSQAGSLLLWVTLLGLWSSALLFWTRRRAIPATPYATALLLGLAAFFCGLLVFAEPPFARTHILPVEGVGLNPLLRHPSMMVHPPMLYSGYTLFAVPMAFAFGALVTRTAGLDWIRFTRPFALAAWLCLGTGIVLGARWSYAELGWGGYWAWDPVENASLMPWLCGTAFLHSALIQEKRGMLKTWNVALVLATGILALLGTFLVRSGILDSIHAFGASTLGGPFLLLISALVVLSVVLVTCRLSDLRSQARLDSLFSREAAFLLNNIVLVALCFVIFWGTFFPLISEAVTGQKASVGPPWFGRYIVPLSLVLVLLAGLGPALSWRRVTLTNFRRALLVPLAACCLTFSCSLLISPVAGKPAAGLMFALAVFVVAVIAQEFWRGIQARRSVTGEPRLRATIRLIGRNRRRYGGYVVHVGVVVLFVGVAASSAFQHVRDLKLAPGQSAHVGGYKLSYTRPTSTVVAARNGRLERIDIGAIVELSRGRQRVARLTPRRSFFVSNDPAAGPLSRFFEGEATSAVALRAGLMRDVWVAITPDLGRLKGDIQTGDHVFTAAKSLPESERNAALGTALKGLTRAYAIDPPAANFRIIVSPLVTWIWLGAVIAFAGGLFALSAPRSRRVVLAPTVGSGLVTTEQWRHDEIEAAKAAKYREISEAEMDFRVGKLSEPDWVAIDHSLRSEAVELLHQADALANEDTGLSNR